MLVLIVEDDFLIAHEAADVLAGAGYRTRLARQAEEALAHLESDRPALVIVDLALRDGLSGPAVASRFADAGVPVLVCSGYSEAAIRDRTDHRVVAMLVKPIPPDLLLATVDAVLRGQPVPV